MKTIPLTDITLGSRQRRHIDKGRLYELALSIRDKGLFHAIVCIETPDGLRLVAGERRLRAIKIIYTQEHFFSHDGEQVPLDSIPYILINSDFDALKIREAELEENLIRIDLTWQDKVAALDELHELRITRDPKHTILDTAKEVSAITLDGNVVTDSKLRQGQRDVERSRLVAKHLDDPEVANATTLHQAHTIVSRHLEAELELELTRRGKATVHIHTLLHADFMEEATINQLPQDFSCIIADPPYGISAHAFGDAASTTHTYEDNEETAIAIAKRIFDVALSHTLPAAHLYMFCDIDLFKQLRGYGRYIGWNVWRTPLIWRKTSTNAHAPALNRGFRRSYELILFATKGDKPFSAVYPDVMDASATHVKEVAAQKPSELYETMLIRSCLPGDKVLDPCCGSGTIFKAAEITHVEAWGIEKDQSAHAIANLTLSDLGGKLL